MRLLIGCFALLLCLAATGDDSQAVSQITDLNLLLQQATKRYDDATVSKMMSGDFVLVNGRGQVLDRDATLKDIGDRSAVWIANEPSDVSVRVYNGDCAIVVALLHLKYKQAGKLHDILGRYTDVWIKDGASWKYASGQANVYKRFDNI